MNDATPTLNENFFRQLCQHLGVAIVGSDTDLHICSWNAAAARMFGAGVAQMIGTSVLSIVPQERRRGAERLLRRSIRTGQTFQFDFSHKDDHGQRRELAVTIAPIIMEAGHCVGSSLCIRDITRRITLQNELLESRKMVALGELAGVISHHFNNILGGAITSIDYAVASHDARIQRKVLDQTGRGLQRAAKLVNGLLVSSGRGQRSEDLSDFTEVLNGVVHDTERLIVGRKISFCVNQPDLPVTPVPRIQVATVLRNIIENAVEAMPDGGELTIDVNCCDDFLLTRVTDTGRGLDDEAVSRVFEPFWSTKGPRPAGEDEITGLGLAIARGLVQVIGGKISVESKVGEGSSFIVSIPRPHEALGK